MSGNRKTAGWVPQRGQVRIREIKKHVGDNSFWQAHCAGCSWTYGNVIKSDVAHQKTNHRCPPGTEGSLPECPNCHSKSARCKRPSGHAAAEWHSDRQRLFEQGIKS